MQSRHSDALDTITINKKLNRQFQMEVESMRYLLSYINQQESLLGNELTAAHFQALNRTKMDINAKLNLLDDIKMKTDHNDRLSKEQKGKIRFLIEKYKLAIMQHVLASLNSFNPNAQTAPKNKKKKSSWIRTAGFGVLILLGLILPMAEGFNSSQTLLSLIPGITNGALLGVSTMFSAISAVLFCNLEGRSLKNALGVAAEDGGSLVEIYDAQVKTVNKINNVLLDTSKENGIRNMKKSADYARYIPIAKKFNHHISQKKQEFQNYKESDGIKITRRIFMGLGGILAAGSAFFGAQSMLLTFGVTAAFLSGPLGLAILSGVALLGAIFYYTLQSKGLFGIFNPNAKKFNEVKKELDATPVKDKEFDNVLSDKKVHEQLHLIRSSARENHASATPRPERSLATTSESKASQSRFTLLPPPSKAVPIPTQQKRSRDSGLIFRMS